MSGVWTLRVPNILWCVGDTKKLVYLCFAKVPTDTRDTGEASDQYVMFSTRHLPIAELRAE